MLYCFFLLIFRSLFPLTSPSLPSETVSLKIKKPIDTLKQYLKTWFADFIIYLVITSHISSSQIVIQKKTKLKPIEKLFFIIPAAPAPRTSFAYPRTASDPAGYPAHPSAPSSDHTAHGSPPPHSRTAAGHASRRAWPSASSRHPSTSTTVLPPPRASPGHWPALAESTCTLRLPSCATHWHWPRWVRCLAPVCPAWTGARAPTLRPSEMGNCY